MTCRFMALAVPPLMAFSLSSLATPPAAGIQARDAAMAEQRTLIAKLAWLQGSWSAEKEGVFQEEHWSMRNGALAGMAREMKDGRSNYFEILALEPDDPAPALRIRHFGPVRPGISWTAG